MDQDMNPENRKPMERVLYEVKKVIVGQDHLLERLVVALLARGHVLVEGVPGLAKTMAIRTLAEAIGGVPVRLPPGAKAAYHAAAVLASGGLIALLDTIVSLAAAAGLDERGSVAIYGRLMEQTLANARAVGVAAALTGPIVRGDVGTVQAHLDALARLAPAAVDLYLAAARRELDIAGERGALAPEQVERVRSVLAKVG